MTVPVTAGRRSVLASVVGRPVAVPAELLTRYPELAAVRLRRGGLPPRVGGLCLGMRSVAGITLWGTVFVGADTNPSAALLLHELRHVQQFQADPLFPLRYVWETVRRGYGRNRYELDAVSYAQSHLRRES
jgi:hypothetical protein